MIWQKVGLLFVLSNSFVLVAQLILASSSKRRVALLKQIGITPTKIIIPSLKENMKIEENPYILAKELAYEKAAKIKRKISGRNFFVLAADTIVYRAKKIFDKSSKSEDVKNYLKQLSSRKHLVYGGICIISPDNIVSKKTVKTEVFFNKIHKFELDNNSLIKEGIDKSGGYAIQGHAAKFISKIKGSYTNVVGLSLSNTYQMLLGLGFFDR